MNNILLIGGILILKNRLTILEMCVLQKYWEDESDSRPHPRGVSRRNQTRSNSLGTRCTLFHIALPSRFLFSFLLFFFFSFFLFYPPALYAHSDESHRENFSRPRHPRGRNRIYRRRRADDVFAADKNLIPTKRASRRLISQLNDPGGDFFFFAVYADYVT